MGSEDNNLWSGFPKVPDDLESILHDMNRYGDPYDMDTYEDQDDMDTYEDQDDKNGPDRKKKKLIPRKMIGGGSKAKSGGSSQRKSQASNELPKGKRKVMKERRQTSTFDVGEPSEASQQPAPKGTEKLVKELIKTKSVAELKGEEESVRVLITVKKKSVPKVLKNLRDRANRRIKIDEREDMLSCICLLRFVMEHKVSYLFSPIVQSLNKIVSQWPARSDLNCIKKSIRDMEDKERNKAKQPRHEDDDDEKVIRVLEKIEHDIKSLDDKRVQDSAKANELAEIFTTEGISVETLKEKLSTAFPWLFWGEIATNKLPNAKGKGKGKGLEVPVEELIKKNSVAKVLKNLRDRVNRRIKIGQRADMESCIRLMCFVIEHRVDSFFSPIVLSLNKITSQWPTRSDLDDIKKDIKQMEDEVRDKGKLHKPDDLERDMGMIRRLEEIERKLKSSDEEFRKDSTNVINLGKIFTTEGVSVKTLREELTTAFPWLFLEEIATNELPCALDLEETITIEDPADVDPEGQLSKGIDGIGDKADNKSQTTSSITPNGSYGIPEAIKVLDSLSEVPKPSKLYFFSLKLLTTSEKRLVFLSLRHELRAWWLKEEMDYNSKHSNGP